MAPRLFVSYSWTSPEHEDWVLGLATELQESGVDVILDKWDLREGQDANAFMESMVTDSSVEKVMIVCDRLYAEKADGRAGGVGTETQIISAEVYEAADQTKYVAVLPERDDGGQPFLPAYYGTRKYIDLSSPELYAKNFEQLLRWIYDKPMYVKPEVGDTPAFLSEDSTRPHGTSVLARRAAEALRQDRTHAEATVEEYFESIRKVFESYGIAEGDDAVDERLITAIDEFIPVRNEIIGVFALVCRYRPTAEAWSILHRFFEALLPLATDDSLRFLGHELFLYAAALLLQHERFDGLAYLLGTQYYSDELAGTREDPMVTFADFRQQLPTLEARNKRLDLNRMSLHSDLLEQRSHSSGIPFQQVMQADFTLYIRDCLDVLQSDRHQGWWPETLLYANRQYGPFEIFARAKSSKYFERLMPVLGVAHPDELDDLKEAFSSQLLRVPRWGIHSPAPLNLMGFHNLATVL